MLLRLRGRAPFPVLVVATLACGNPLPPPNDANGEVLPGCADPLRVEGVLGETVSVRVDTTGGAPGTVPISGCGATTRAAQAVVAVGVPGTGPRTLTVSTVTAGTDTRFDTVLALRRHRCLPLRTDEAPDACFDDVSLERERRSRGTILTEGGDEVFVVVTGYAGLSTHSDNGIAELDVTVSGASPPTLESASILVTPESVRVDVDAGDVDGDAAAVHVTFHGPAGELLDIDQSGAPTAADYLEATFDRPVLQAVTFRESATVALSTPEAHAAIAGATTAQIVILDAAGLTSETALRVPVRTGAVVGPGATCSATQICASELVCAAADSTCQPAPDRAAACAVAEALTIDTPTDGTATTGLGTALLSSGAGLFVAQCLPAETGGRETIFRITVPMGSWDLHLTTDSSGTAGTDPLSPDTVLYVRRVCTDSGPTSAPMEWCNDDAVMDENFRSTVDIRDVAPGDLFAFVELYATSAPVAGEVRVELAATLRPVLPAGASCDPSGVENRCATGVCPVSSRTCPP